VHNLINHLASVIYTSPNVDMNFSIYLLPLSLMNCWIYEEDRSAVQFMRSRVTISEGYRKLNPVYADNLRYVFSGL
jgi:hypothetical protein